MIVFCEDCGKKNHQPASVLKNGRLKFRCAVCGYLNNYALTPPSPGQADKPAESAPAGLESLIRQIRRIQQVQGFFLFHTDKGVIRNKMPGMLKASDLDFLGKHLIHAYLKGTRLLDGIRAMRLAIGLKTLVIRQIQPQLFIIMTGTDPDFARAAHHVLARWTETAGIQGPGGEA